MSSQLLLEVSLSAKEVWFKINLVRVFVLVFYAVGTLFSLLLATIRMHGVCRIEIGDCNKVYWASSSNTVLFSMVALFQGLSE